jgi:hypothetical protein
LRNYILQHRNDHAKLGQGTQQTGYYCTVDVKGIVA